MGWLTKIFGKKPEDFEIELGPEWKAAHEDTHFCWNDEANLRQVTISVLRSKKRLEKPELFIAALDLLRIRQELIMNLSNGQATISEPISVNRDDGFDITALAVDPVNEVQIKFAVLARPLRTISVSFNKYDPPLPDDEFEHQAASVLSAVKVRQD